MYTKTDKDYLYYKLNNIYFKLPTFGYLFKIIDFGRATFEFHNKFYMNDSFQKYGEADGQFHLPFNYLNYNIHNRKSMNINYNFDLCRLATTILDVYEYDNENEYGDKKIFFDFIYNMTLHKEFNSLYELNDDFNMYIDITNKACNALPVNIIQNSIFNKYRIKKKNFPKKLFYHV